MAARGVTAEEITDAVRAEHGRVVAALVRRFGDIDVAEDAVGEALLAAAQSWPAQGIPANPGGWLTTTATRKAIDRLRRESTRQQRHEQAVLVHAPAPPPLTGPVQDDRLRLVFTCCHPALAQEARVALTLRLLGGLTVAEIASAFLVPDTTMAQRLTRAKRKIRQAEVPYRVPAAEDLPKRLSGVLTTLYLVFNEGYLSSGHRAADRPDLTAEAVRLTRTLRELMPDEPEVGGLLALMLLTQARRPARLVDGELVPLGEQDRTRWDSALLREGLDLVRECLRVNRPGPFQLLAATNAVHADAATPADTDWTQVLALYDQLMQLAPTPVVALNRAVAVAEVTGPAAGLALVDDLDLPAYAPLHVARAEMLRRLGRTAEARAAYDTALSLTDNPAERALLLRKRART